MLKEKEDLKINGGCKQWKRQNKILTQKLKHNFQMLMPSTCYFLVNVIVNVRKYKN